MVELPASGDVRQFRAQAARALGPQFALLRGPLLAWLGAGDVAVTTLTGRDLWAGRRPRVHPTTPGGVYAQLMGRGQDRLARLRAQPRVASTLRIVDEVTVRFNRHLEYALDELNDSSEEFLGRLSLQTYTG
jgi:heparin binding hemagglutinin HbhA